MSLAEQSEVSLYLQLWHILYLLQMENELCGCETWFVTLMAEC
jgi:hypothetical protein